MLATHSHAAALRFEGATLLVFEAVETSFDPNFAAQLLAWQAPAIGLTQLAIAVDPGSLHASRDGRWLSIEANDQAEDRVRTVELVLVDLTDLSRLSLGMLDQARARFTRDSSALVFSGYEAGCHATVARSLLDGSTHQVACVSAAEMYPTRWELSADSQWLVHLQNRDRFDLMRTALTGDSAEILAEGVTSSPGKEFDIAHGGDSVAFLRVSSSLNDSLFAIPWPASAGGSSPSTADESLLVAGDVTSIVEHYEELVLYRHFPTRDPNLLVDRCEERLGAVSLLDGQVHDLGPFADETACSPSAAAVLDEAHGGLLVRGSDRALRWLPGPTQSPIHLACDVLDAKFVSGGRVLFSTGPGASLLLYDPKTGVISQVLPELTGPFLVDPVSDSSFLTTIPSGAGSTLIRASLP